MDSAAPTHRTSDSKTITTNVKPQMPKRTMFQEGIESQGGWVLKTDSIVPVKDLKTKPIYEMNRCFYNAILNKNYYYEGRNLRVVFGAFKIGTRFVYGYADPMTIPRREMNGGCNVHAWLEDDDGRIYDCLYSEIVGQVPKANKKKMKAGVMEGKTREELKDMNCFYLPYASEIQMLWAITLFSFLLSSPGLPYDSGSAAVRERFMNETIDLITTSKSKASKFRVEFGQANFNKLLKEAIPVLAAGEW